MIRWILVAILLLLSLTFFLQNQEQEVTLRYFFGLREASTELWRPVLSAFAIGILVASILLFPAWVRGRLELRRKTKALQEAEADLEQVRQALEKTSRQAAGQRDRTEEPLHE
ncbi:MAG: LapA family protein [Nitrospira sp.]|nr:LapA family protein [Nitrospira sp.]